MVAYVIAFVVENSDETAIDFVFGTARVSLIFLILLVLAAGVLGGVLLSQLYRHRRRRRLEKEARKRGDSRRDVVRADEAVGKPR